MKENFKNANFEKLKKKDFEKSFYEHYFRSIVNSEQMAIESFYHPKNSKSKTKNCPKTINTAYIENIAKSSTFVNDFLSYLNNFLEGEYREVIDLKIKGLIQRWENDYMDNNQNEKVIEEISNYIEKNKKCKLPWTMKEVDEAIMSVRKLFELANNN
jgi:hypothetical protein